jgi:formylglycine-generating enzyme required for sulfatase activity
MDLWEVTADAYALCVGAKGCTDQGLKSKDGTYKVPGKNKYPINRVEWEQARTYCQWNGKRLPTEQEWEYAARGSEGRRFPWSTGEPGQQLCWKQSGPCQVGSYPDGKSWAGVQDLAGNVWEWTESKYCADADPRCSAPDREHFVIRGGGWDDTEPDAVRASYRGHAPPTRRDLGFQTIGFRCVSTVSSGR